MKKIAYTVIFGNYDKLKEPSVISEGWDYYLITDNTEIVSDIFNIIYIDLNLTDVKNSKFCKIKYWEFLPEADYFLYVDGSIQINTDLNEFCKDFYDYDMTLLKHPCRNCLYEEARIVLRDGIDKPKNVNPQIKKYLDFGFPMDYGLTANGVMFRKDSKEVRAIMDDWWLEVEVGSMRDQLSFEYAKWLHEEKVNINILDRYWELLESTNGEFRYIQHGK